jgi:hypothetical protein
MGEGEINIRAGEKLIGLLSIPLLFSPFLLSRFFSLLGSIDSNNRITTETRSG